MTVSICVVLSGAASQPARVAGLHEIRLQAPSVIGGG